jgi:hypothetical protein
VALTILPGAAVGPNPEGETAASQIPPEVAEHLGTTKPPPEWVSTDAVRRSTYYFASYRFVKYLVDLKGMDTFMKLYSSENPEMEIRSLYGLTREEAIRGALKEGSNERKTEIRGQRSAISGAIFQDEPDVRSS